MPRSRWLACLFLVFLWSPLGLGARSVSLLSVGNSFSQNAHSYLAQLTEAAGHQIVLTNAVIGGCDFERHMRHADAYEADPSSSNGRPYYGGRSSLKELLCARPWDLVTIQQASPKSFKPETYHPHVDRLIAYIRANAPGAEILIHETWAYRDDHAFFGLTNLNTDEMYRLVRAAYDGLASETGFRLIPSGDAFEAARLDPAWGRFLPDPTFDRKSAQAPTLPTAESRALHEGFAWKTNARTQVAQLAFDGIHANRSGKYLLGCVWLESVFGVSAEGNSFLPAGMKAEDAAILQRVAHRVVSEKRRP